MKAACFAAAAAALLLGGMALADEPKKSSEPTLYSNVGMTFEVGGGVGGFLDTRATDITKTQGNWTARLTLGSRYHLGGEAAYIGSAQSLNALGVDRGAFLMGNGLEGAIRVNVLTGMWQPYAIAGAGWTHYSVQSTTVNSSDVKDQGDVAHFPLGVGLAFRYKGFVADARFAFGAAAPAPLIPDVNLSTWTAAARLGFEF